MKKIFTLSLGLLFLSFSGFANVNKGEVEKREKILQSYFKNNLNSKLSLFLISTCYNFGYLNHFTNPGYCNEYTICTDDFAAAWQIHIVSDQYFYWLDCQQPLGHTAD